MKMPFLFIYVINVYICSRQQLFNFLYVSFLTFQIAFSSISLKFVYINCKEKYNLLQKKNNNEFGHGHILLFTVLLLVVVARYMVNHVNHHFDRMFFVDRNFISLSLVFLLKSWGFFFNGKRLFNLLKFRAHIS